MRVLAGAYTNKASGSSQETTQAVPTSKARLLLSPGIYWIGGSGLQIQSDGMVVSKALGDDVGNAPSGGVLIYNTVDPLPTTGCTGAGCYGPITINGGGGTPTLALSRSRPRSTRTWSYSSTARPRSEADLISI